MDDIPEIDLEKAMAQNAMAAHMWYLEYESVSHENERLNSRVAELDAALIEAEAAHATARDTALEEAADCAIDNHDCDAWEIAAIIRALKRERAVE